MSGHIVQPSQAQAQAQAQSRSQAQAQVQPLVRPQETPECESSTGHVVSFHDPVYHHDTWWNWVGLLGLAVLVVGAVGFMIGRIIAL